MSANHIQLHFKSMSGDITSLETNPVSIMEEVQQQLAKSLSVEADQVIIMDHLSEDDSIPPRVKPDYQYSYLIRSHNEVSHLRIWFREEATIIDPSTGIRYVKYEFAVIDLAQRATSHSQTFAIYYDSDLEWFIPSSLFQQTSDDSGAPTVSLNPHLHPLRLYDAVYSSLYLPWYERTRLARSADEHWNEVLTSVYDEQDYESEGDNEEFWNRHYELRNHMTAYGGYHHDDEI
jgi:hypothetical protein